MKTTAWAACVILICGAIAANVALSAVRSLPEPLAVLVTAANIQATPALREPGYQMPPKEVVEIIDTAPTMARTWVSPDNSYLLSQPQRNLVSISDLTAPTIALADLQIDPRRNSLAPSTIHAGGLLGLKLQLTRIADAHAVDLDGMPVGDFGPPLWSPDGKRFIFLHKSQDGIDLWVASVETKMARQLTKPVVNAVSMIGDLKPDYPAFRWMPDSHRVLCLTIPPTRGGPPNRPLEPAGPVISATGLSAIREGFSQDQLKDGYDEDLFDYYATSQPLVIDVETGSSEAFAHPGIYFDLQPSPDGNTILSTRLTRPYPHRTAYYDFAKVVEVLDGRGKVLTQLAQLSAGLPGPGTRVQPGPRGFNWRPDRAASITFVEALDGGDSLADVPYRDRLMMLEAPYTTPVELFRARHRLLQVGSGDAMSAWTDDGRGIVKEVDRKNGALRFWLIRPKDSIMLLEERNVATHGNSGPEQVALMFDASRQGEVLRDQDWIYISEHDAGGDGGNGRVVCLDRLNLTNDARERLFVGSANISRVVAVLDPKGKTLLIQRERAGLPPSYELRDLRKHSRRVVVAPQPVRNPLSEAGVRRIDYLRDDGLPLKGILTLPLGYSANRKVPAVLWGYPIQVERGAFLKEKISGELGEFATAGRHIDPRNPIELPAILLTQGYAVFFIDAPLIGTPTTAYETFRRQMVADFEAAAKKLVELGITDRETIGLGGASFGAKMTATVLANSIWFAAGIAISGAYNETETPLHGVNRELSQSLYEAPSVYIEELSPLMHADRIAAPLLLIHGEKDSDPGTPVSQSTSMYDALQGLGKTARLVVLPGEDHGFFARESIMQVAHEMIDWFDKYLKVRLPSGAPKNVEVRGTDK